MSHYRRRSDAEGPGPSSYGGRYESAERGGRSYGGHGKHAEQQEGYGYGSSSEHERYAGGGSEYGATTGGYSYDVHSSNSNNKKNSYSAAKAHRLRCSAIAVGSDEDCQNCCQMAARKDRSVGKRSIVGFLVDYDEIRYSAANGYYNTEKKRYKRDAEAQPPAIQPPANYAGTGKTSTTSSAYATSKSTTSENKGYGIGVAGSSAAADQGTSSYDNKGSSSSGYGYKAPAKPENTNPRCVCCAPKSHVDHHYTAAEHGSQYGGGQEAGGYGSVQEKMMYGGGGGYESQGHGSSYA